MTQNKLLHLIEKVYEHQIKVVQTNAHTSRDPKDLARRRKEIQEIGYDTLDESFIDSNISCNDIAINAHLYTFNEIDIPHRHSFFELIYVYRGAMTNQADKNSIYLNSGDFLLINPYMIHNPKVVDENSLIINILFRQKLFTKIFFSLIIRNELFSKFFLNSLHKEDNRPDCLVFISDTFNKANVEFYLTALLEEYFSHNPNNQEYIENLISCIFIELERGYYTEKSKKQTIAPKACSIDDIILYICGHFNEATLQSTAKVFGYHPKYLSKLIKEQYGKSFSELKKLYKLQYAANLLNQTDLSISDILEKINCTNNSYFYKAFKDLYGVPPKSYRNIEHNPPSIPKDS